jgi:hypothetical protein
MLTDAIDAVRKFYSYYPRPWKTRAQLVAYLGTEAGLSDEEGETLVEAMLEGLYLSAVMSCRLDPSIDVDDLDLESRVIPGPLLYEIDPVEVGV